MASGVAAARALVVKFVGQVDPSLAKSVDKVTGALGKTDGETKTVSQRIRTGLKVAAVAAGAAAVKLGKDSVAAFKSAAGETLGYQRVLGGTAEEASQLRFAIKMSGVDAGVGSKGFTLFSKTLSKAAETGKGTKAMTKLLGEGFTDAQGKLLPMNKILPGLMDKFQKMPAGPERTALAMKLFGKNGAAMLPFLTKGSSGLAELSKKSDEYGQTLSGSNLQALKDSKSAQRDWGAAVEGFKVQFGAQLLPMITSGVKLFTSQLIPTLTGVSGFLRDNGDAVGIVIGVVGGLVGLVKTVTAITRAWSVVQGVLNVVMSANPIALVVIAIAALVAGLVYAYNNCKEFRDVVDTAFTAIAAAGRWLWNNALQPVLKAIVQGFAWVVDGVAGFLEMLGQVPGFEWAKDAAVGLRGVAKNARDAANSIGKIPDAKVDTGKSQTQVEKLDARIRALKDKKVKAEATGDTTQVDRLAKKIRDLKGKKAEIEANVKKTGITTIKLKDIPKGGGLRISAYARGGITNGLGQLVKGFANGSENHVAQIAQAGAYRLWAEPETGGEAYLPLAASKRSKTIPMWWETGRRLGVVPYADGGINGVRGLAPGDDLAAAIAKLADRVLTREDLTVLLDALRRATPSQKTVVRL